MRALSPLARLRRQAGWTQRDAADAAGVSLRTYQRLEAGTHVGGDPMGIRIELARRLSGVLGRPVSAQWDLSGPRSATDPGGARRRQGVR